mmetsp:Transcript_16718/g.31371  ORF Transcript_16718/g.31371 Transcript_16718/m.31371 type:complete len:452 (-) Transcript_16718:3180-4535(-)|eukprot:CAMPEP_0114443728 /NCGR_PEP_ID=MMETSP0103-20121206/17688_1 /TAXON_ID=37642 ORGANISM="Paraphysomonas imperforata, Strain PA2" /NCGR_SAMPLE_ID=MMETSP0103 /ASSEMBLY_ACC=CAM_ASM_000201 /LENGTH=451 /DNA_ID=CAMNT_0001615179 /DNA_START=47 /DNA_END=1402 /DNA_ORIENTATION=-
MGLDFRDRNYRRYVTLGKRTVKDGEAMLIWNRNGVTTEVIGPRLVYLYCSAIRFLSRYTAGSDEYLVVTKIDGRVEHIPGPISLFENPTLHKSVAVMPAFSLTSASECIVLHRQIPAPLVKTEAGFVTPIPSSGGQQIERLFLQGPAQVFPGVGDSVLNFAWSCPQLAFEEKLPFNILNTARRQVKSTSKVAFRGENKITGNVQMLVSMQIVDVSKMVDTTNNVMADLNDALEVDMNHISLLAIETIQEVSDLDVFNTLDSFPHLTARAQEMGVHIDHVLYVGFLPAESLRHHVADLANVHAKYAKDCIVNEQKQQQMAMELNAKKDRLAQEDSFLKAEITMKQEHLESMHRYHETQLENKLILQKRQEDFDLEMLSNKNKESIRSLQTLSELGVDLTKLLCSKYCAGSDPARFGLTVPTVDLGDGSKATTAQNVIMPKQLDGEQYELVQH